MQSDVAIGMMAGLFWTGLLVCLPVVALVTLVGVAINVVQVITQVQEQTLTFVPKLATATITLVLFGPWMLRTLAQYTVHLWASIPGMF